MKNKTVICFVCVLLSSLFISGCDTQSTSESLPITTITLNDRQKQILEEMELPTDYDSLNHTQQHAIKRIEVMLSYLEDKYEMDFSYAGYVPAGAMEGEHLTAYPTADGTGAGANYVTVKPYGETFKDNYSSKEICKYYESLVTTFVRDYFQSEQAKVIVNGFSTSMETTDEITDGCFHYKAGTNTLVFVSDTICDEKKMSKFAEAMKLWFEGHEIVTLHSRLSLIYDDDVTDITRNTIADYYTNKKLNLNGDYQIFIYGEEIERNKIVPNSRGSG